MVSSTQPSPRIDVSTSFMESFGHICSVEQMELCQKLGILSKSEQQQAYKIAKAWMGQIPIDPNDLDHLTEWILMLRDRYSAQLESQCIRQHTNDLERIGYLDEVQRLSQLLEEYGGVHEDLTDLLQALRKLSQDWKHRKRDVENIVLSILSSNKDAAHRVVRVTRSHLATLGLGIASIGKYYIVYEPSTTGEQQKEILNHVAKNFSMVFEENAAQNLARMAGSYHRIFQEESDMDLMDRIQKLSSQVFVQRPKSVVLPYPSSLPGQEQDTRRNSSFLERRKSVVLVENQLTMPMVFNMTMPLFEPAGWDWPHMLKHKQSNQNYWCHSTTTTHHDVWSTSIARLADHFAQVGQAYYANMHNNARLMHSHRSQMFEFATHSLMKTYRALQLEQGCANLNRVLTFLYRLQQENSRI
ncbi:uncharacterized protein B0P05DRAFT_550140 [Gilbertella persicaria]|uniref:uncharacterized protein n=1 Tax=Gilbertella persicaria TaxID=101096 RepID=UPI00221EAB42|nr:uncharacterized protein B0P05DRAFT_550140 [Gilbertella persicaria]KAI8070549.1 hypothetical protein B0P05DRAFT_550140 [Gilbertella persicaria]